MFSVHVNRMLAIRDGYWQKSESAFQFLNIGTHIHGA